MNTPEEARAADARRLQAIVDRISVDATGALAAAQEFLAGHAELPAAWRAVALATRMTGDAPAADRLDVEAVAVGARQPGLAAAHKALADDHLEDAERLVRAYLRNDDDRDAGAALVLAVIASRCDAHDQAETLARRALLLAPGFDEARMTLARMLYDAGRADGSLVVLDDLLDRVPNHPRALALKATVLVQLRRMEAADAAFRVLHEHYPHDSRGWMNHAFMLKTMGRRDEAIAAYRQALDADPRNGQAWWGLANLKIADLGEADIGTMRTALGQPKLEDDDRLHLLFALGKALEGRERFDEAFESFAMGAALRSSQAPHDPVKIWDDVHRVREVFAPRFYADRDGWGCPKADPIFIVSLPRSGSTLVEQILASHPAIEGTEELFDLERIALGMTGNAQEGYVDRIASLTKDEVQALGEAYITSTSRFRDTRALHFIDKMPSNWVYVGLIRLILPNARIIDIRRHPLGCGVANYTQHFNWGINYSYNLDHIGQFYAAYVRQMAHFDHVLPGYIHHVTHESLVNDLEGEVRRMLSFLDLPFDPACLRFHETRRAIYTPSSEQVRRPINRDGIDRWRHYERWLDPLKNALGPVLAHYPEAPPEWKA